MKNDINVYENEEKGEPIFVKSSDDIPSLVFFNGNFDNKKEWDKTYHNAQGYVDYLEDVIKNNPRKYSIPSLADETVALFGKDIPLFVLSYNISRLNLLETGFRKLLLDNFKNELFEKIDKKAYKGINYDADNIKFISLSKYPKTPKSLSEIQLVDFTLQLIQHIEAVDEIYARNKQRY